MFAIFGEIVVSALLWHVLLSGLFRREVSWRGPKAYADSASASAGTFLQIVLLGLGGFGFAVTHAPILDIAPSPVWTAIICATLGKWLVDFAYMFRDGTVNWYDILHHVVSGAILVYALWVQTGAWFLGVAVFLSEVPGMTFFATRTLQRAGLATLPLVLGLRSLHFVLAATMWLLLIPAFTLYFLQSWGFTPLMVAMCAGYNVFTLWSAHKLLTRTPRALREMARELSEPRPAPLTQR